MKLVNISTLSFFQGRKAYTDEMYNNSVYKLEDIFRNETLSQLQSSNFTMSHIDTLAYGRCFTICPQREMEANEFLTLGAKRNLELKMIVHPKGEEVWLSGEDGKSPYVDGLPIELLNARF